MSLTSLINHMSGQVWRTYIYSCSACFGSSGLGLGLMSSGLGLATRGLVNITARFTLTDRHTGMTFSEIAAQVIRNNLSCVRTSRFLSLIYIFTIDRMDRLFTQIAGNFKLAETLKT